LLGKAFGGSALPVGMNVAHYRFKPGRYQALATCLRPEVLRVPLIKNRYGKGRVRVMRIHRDGERHEVSQLNVKAMVEGDFARTYTHADNSNTISTDTIKNVVNVVARENTGLSS